MEVKLDEIGARLETFSSEIAQISCTGNRAFEKVSMNFHRTLETETV
jgi:hypothetical protein